MSTIGKLALECVDCYYNDFSVAVLTVMKLSTLCMVVKSDYHEACTGDMSIVINHCLWQCRFYGDCTGVVSTVMKLALEQCQLL